jgi:hypothetical protein
MEVNMSLMKSLHGKQVFGILLVVVLLIVVFAYGVRAYRGTGSCYSMVPEKKSCNTETCKVEISVEPEKEVAR